MMILATIADPKNVPAKTKIATTKTFQPSFLNSPSLLPTEIPAKARIGVVVPRNTTSFVYFRKNPAVGINGMLRSNARSDAQAKAGNFSGKTP